jgi:hypothetical protein
VKLIDAGIRALKPLGGHFKTGHLWTGQNRPFPAAETGEERGHSRGVAEQLPPVVDRPV